MKALKKLNKYFYRYKYLLILGVVFITISNIFAIIPAQLVRNIIDIIVSETDFIILFENFTLYEKAKTLFFGSVIFLGLLLLISALLKGFFLFLTRQTVIVMSRHIEYDMKNDIYDHYQSLPLSFYRSNNTGDLMNRISEDVSRVRMYIGPAIMYGLNIIVLFTLVISYMFSVNTTLTIYVLLPLPILSISIYYVSDKMNKRSEEIQRSLSGLSTFVQEAFSGIRVIKSFAREADSVSKFSKKSNEYKQKSLKLAMINALFFPLIMGLIGLSTILTVYAGGVQVMDGNVTVGNIAEFVMYVYMLTWPVASLGWVTSIVQRAAASQERINEFMDTKTDIVSEKNITDPIVGEIEFRNVGLTYSDSGVEAIKDLSFKIPAGQVAAIVGTTGSGKSTIASLISRMYDTSSGQILIDGKDIKDYEVSYLRSQMGYVPQDVFLFSDTIGNNITFGKRDANQEEMEQAAKDADVYENIMDFDKKFDTIIGERGITLSGGQKQRVSIARALIKKPQILLLDDCLSAVDTKTEDTILNNLSGIMKDRTSVIISHRVSSVKLANHIIVLDDGKIVEEGTHEDLMSKNGVYKDLYEMQQQEADHSTTGTSK